MVRDGKAAAQPGVFLLKNAASSGYTRADRGKPAYVLDKDTVGPTTSNSLVAGLVVDVTSEGVWVDTSLTAIAAGRAFATAEAAAAAATSAASVTSN